MSELTQSRPDAGAFVPASVLLQKLHDEAPAGHVTLDWLMSSLQKQSFGLLMLVLAIVAAAPGICLIGGLLLLIPAFQMIMGRPAPTFPRGIRHCCNRPGRGLANHERRLVSFALNLQAPALRFLLTMIRRDLLALWSH